MDFSGFDAVTVGAFVGSLIKAFMSDSKASRAEAKAKEIEEARAATKIERDTRIAVLEEKNKYLESRLSEGNDRFEKVEKKIDETNKNVEQTNHILGEIKGALMNSGLVFSGTPVIRRSGHTPEKEPV